MTQEDFVRQIARNLDLPEALVERLIESRAANDKRGAGWKVVRMPSLEELKECSLEDRFASAGWRTTLRSIIED